MSPTAAIIALTLASLAADTLARARHPGPAFLVGLLNAAGWAVLLGRPDVSLVRSVALFSAASPLLTAAVAVGWFREPLDARRALGLVAAVLAIALLGGE